MDYEQIKKVVELAATKLGYVDKEGLLMYRNQQLIIVVNFKKSPFEERLEHLELLITPHQFLGRYGADEPLTVENAIIKVPIFDRYPDENSKDNEYYLYSENQLLTEIDQVLEKVMDPAYIKRLITSQQIKVNCNILKEWDLSGDTNLDYNTVYLGIGLEIQNKIENYFGQHQELIHSGQMIPDNLEVTNLVGLNLKYILYERFIVDFYITKSFEFTIINLLDQKQYFHYNDYSDFMTIHKLNTYMYDLSMQAIFEQIRILDIAIANIIQNQSFRPLDIDKSYTQMKTKYTLISMVYGLIKMLLFIAALIVIIIGINTIVKATSSDPLLDNYLETKSKHELETFTLPVDFIASSSTEPIRIEFTQNTTTQYDMAPYYKYAYEYAENEVEPGIYTLEFKLATDNQYQFKISNKSSQLKFDVMNKPNVTSTNKIINVPIYPGTEFELLSDQPILGSVITLKPQSAYINYQQSLGAAGYYRVESLTDKRYLTIINQGNESITFSYATTEGQEFYELYSDEKMKIPVKDGGTLIINNKTIDFE